MSALLLPQAEFVSASTTAVAPAPMMLPTQSTDPIVFSRGNPVVPSGQKHTCTFSVSAAANKNEQYTSYPLRNDNEQLFYTYASFREEPITALALNRRHDDTWTLYIPVPIPSTDTTNNPILLAVNYTINYATTHDNGNSTIQTDAIVTPLAFPEGVLTDSYGIAADVYRNRMSYGPRMINHDLALRLSTTLAIKCNGGGEQWSHYIDNEVIAANVRILDAQARLYVVLHVNEYPTAKTVRSLSVEVSATWQKGEGEMEMGEEAPMDDGAGQNVPQEVEEAEGEGGTKVGEETPMDGAGENVPQEVEETEGKAAPGEGVPGQTEEDAPEDEAEKKPQEGESKPEDEAEEDTPRTTEDDAERKTAEDYAEDEEDTPRKTEDDAERKTAEDDAEDEEDTPRKTEDDAENKSPPEEEVPEMKELEDAPREETPEKTEDEAESKPVVPEDGVDADEEAEKSEDEAESWTEVEGPDSEGKVPETEEEAPQNMEKDEEPSEKEEAPHEEGEDEPQTETETPEKEGEAIDSVPEKPDEESPEKKEEEGEPKQSGKLIFATFLCPEDDVLLKLIQAKPHVFQRIENPHF